MMFVTAAQLRKSLESLRSIHPFFAISFLACKRAGLPIGRAVATPITEAENSFLRDFYDPNPQSKYFYRASRLSVHDRHWVPKEKYASSGLQSIRTRGHFAAAFTHERNTDLWGWDADYVSTLKECLSLNTPPFRGKAIPAFDLAVWMTRHAEWPSGTTPKQIVEGILSTFRITKDERRFLFDVSIPNAVTPATLFQELPLSWTDMRDIIGSPPDAKQEEGAALVSLSLQSVGPVKNKITFEPADRVSLITGDNGLGKTFVLECAWWALTGFWAGGAAVPYLHTESKGLRLAPRLAFRMSDGKSPGPETKIAYDQARHGWQTVPKRPTIPGLIVYARVDGSFAVWDPAKPSQVPYPVPAGSAPQCVYSRTEVWDGKPPFIEGLIRDWVKWQRSPDQYPYETLKRVLALMSPPDLGLLRPGEPIRLPFDSREIPTLIHPYGLVPITHTSAGVGRIIALAYLIVWAWHEHNVYSKMAEKEPQDRMVILVDEIEAHLHPKWQRSVLPATLDIREELSESLQVQLIAATHSPMTMASMEPFFDEKRDKLFHLDVKDGRVELNEQSFVRYGSISAWLTSEVFNLRHARSREAEGAIEKAKALQSTAKPTGESVAQVSSELTKYLASDDEFWPRWLFFAEKHGVKL